MEKGVVLKKGKEVIFRNRHLWIFSGAIASFPDSFEDGSIAPVFSSDKTLLGHAYFSKGNSLAGRIVSFGSEDPYKAIERHIVGALDFRKAIFDASQTNGYRVLNGEGDLVPGLVADRYADTLVLQSFTLGVDRLLEDVVSIFQKSGEFTSIVEKSTSVVRSEEKLGEKVGVLYGSDPEVIEMRENGMRFFVDWKKGQKTGFFLDQREMRALIRGYAKGKRVLNCFSYTGGFSLAALCGGAREVHSIDISEMATSYAEKNLELNGFSAEKNPCRSEDVFAVLTREAMEYDLVVLDPPAFAKKKKDVQQAIKGYRMINALAMQKMPAGSLLLTCSCSYYIDEETFKELLFQAARECGREISVISHHIQAPDHPLSMYHRESEYLKSFLLHIGA